MTSAKRRATNINSFFMATSSPCCRDCQNRARTSVIAITFWSFLGLALTGAPTMLTTAQRLRPTHSKILALDQPLAPRASCRTGSEASRIPSHLRPCPPTQAGTTSVRPKKNSASAVALKWKHNLAPTNERLAQLNPSAPTPAALPRWPRSFAYVEPG